MNIELTSNQLSQIANVVAQQIRSTSSMSSMSIEHPVQESPEPHLSASPSLQSDSPVSEPDTAAGFEVVQFEQPAHQFFSEGALLPEEVTRANFKTWLKELCIETGHPLSVKSTEVDADGTERVRAYCKHKFHHASKVVDNSRPNQSSLLTKCPVVLNARKGNSFTIAIFL